MSSRRHYQTPARARRIARVMPLFAARVQRELPWAMSSNVRCMKNEEEVQVSDHRCPGCEAMPTSGVESKPPNDDGLVHWCDVSRKAAVEQEILRDPSWRGPTLTPKERAAMERYLRGAEPEVRN